MRAKSFASYRILQCIGRRVYYSEDKQTGTLTGLLALASFLVFAVRFFAFLTTFFFDISFLLSNELRRASPNYAAFPAYKVTFPSTTFPM
jgi:hypothetical protein